MKLNSIQSKIGGALILILLIILGISFTTAALQSRSLLHVQADESIEALHEAVMEQARSVFASLEIGTRGSLERGEMDVFDELLSGLGSVPGVLEVGLVNPDGVTTYSSSKGKVGQKQPNIAITGTTTFGNPIDEKGPIGEESRMPMPLTSRILFAASCANSASWTGR